MPLLSTHLTVAAKLAQREAELHGYERPASEHLLLALISEGEGSGIPVLDELGLSKPIRAKLEGVLGDPASRLKDGEAVEVMDAAARLAARRGDTQIRAEHLLMSMVAADTGVARILEELASRETVRRRLSEVYEEG